MSSNLGRSLEGASLAPQSPLDMSRVWNGARKRARMMRAIAVLSTMAIVAGGVAAYSAMDKTGTPVPPTTRHEDEASFGRYFFRASGDGMKADGVLEVDVAPASICYQGTTSGVVASHLVGLPDVDVAFPHPAPVLAIFFEPGNEDGASEPPGSVPLCLRGGQLGEMESQLQALIDDPRLFKIDFHGPDETTPTLEAELVPQGTEPPKDDEECDSLPVQPTYLPWLEQGERVPLPRESYDAEIDRFSLGWDDPRSDGDGVGLSIYPLPGQESGGEPTNAYVQGVEGRLYRGEGGSISVAWSLDARCNFLELVYVNPELTKGQIETELIRTAKSLEEPESGREKPAYEPPRFRPLQGWFAASAGDAEGGTPIGWVSTFDFGKQLHPRELPNLGPSDIALHAQLVTPSDYINYPLSSFPRRALPLELEDAEIHNSYLEQWNEDIPVRVLNAHVDGHRLMVRIYFGTPDPSNKMLQQAESQLQELQLPPGWEP